MPQRPYNPNKLLLPFLLAVLCFMLLCRHLPPSFSTPQLAKALVDYRFPYRDSAPFYSALRYAEDTLLGFHFQNPASILTNQLPALAHAKLEINTPPVPQVDTNITANENSLPIVETSQTIGALKNTEGTNKNIYITNNTSYDINIEQLLHTSAHPALSGTPTVLIVHTHTTESYTPEGQANYTPSDTTRTQDKTQNVVRVGEEIKKVLSDRGIRVLHDTTINDYPSYNGSYTKTLGVIEWYLSKYPEIQVVLDVHRDGMTKDDGTKLKVTANIAGQKAAQVMLVIGTDEGGLPHENWRQNLQLGLQIQDQLTKQYPGFARPLNLRKERFNQHATPGSMIVEVGSDGNTLSEAVTAGRYFATALADVLRGKN